MVLTTIYVLYYVYVRVCIQPIPYRSAVKDGATHIIVLRTKPDPCVMKEKSAGVFERFIAKR